MIKTFFSWWPAFSYNKSLQPVFIISKKKPKLADSNNRVSHTHMFRSIFSISAFLLGTTSLFGQKVIDKVVAQVGDNIILLSDIESQKIQAKQSGIEVPEGADCMYLEELMYQSLLVNQAVALSRGLGMESILLEVRPSNARALEIYERYGFTEIGRRKGYYPAADSTREDAIVMRFGL